MGELRLNVRSAGTRSRSRALLLLGFRFLFNLGALFFGVAAAALCRGGLLLRFLGLLLRTVGLLFRFLLLGNALRLKGALK